MSGDSYQGGAAESSTGALGNEGSFGDTRFGGIHFGATKTQSEVMSEAAIKFAALGVAAFFVYKYFGGK